MRVVPHGDFRHGLARQRLQLKRDLARHVVRHLLAQGDQERIRVLIVLGLREQVGSDHTRARLIIGDDQNLTRPRDAIDVDDTKDKALRTRDVEVSGPNNFVDATQ